MIDTPGPSQSQLSFEWSRGACERTLVFRPRVVVRECGRGQITTSRVKSPGEQIGRAIRTEDAQGVYSVVVSVHPYDMSVVPPFPTPKCGSTGQEMGPSVVSWSTGTSVFSRLRDH